MTNKNILTDEVLKERADLYAMGSRTTGNKGDCGIYCWTNLVTGKMYVGQSSELNKRHNRFLQFNLVYSGDKINNERHKYNNKKYWYYEVVKYTKRLNETEIAYINKYDSFNNGLNSNEGGCNLNYECKKHKTPVVQLDLEGNVVKVWDSIDEANDMYNGVTNCVCGLSATAKGFVWVKKEVYEQNPKSYTKKYKVNAKPKLSHQLVQLDLEGNIVKIWDSIGQAEYKFKGISKCIYGTSLTGYGYRWVKKSEYDKNPNSYNVTIRPYGKMSIEEKKHKQQERNKRIYASLTIEQKAERNEYHREWRARKKAERFATQAD